MDNDQGSEGKVFRFDVGPVTGTVEGLRESTEGPWSETPGAAAIESFSPAADARVVEVEWLEPDESARVHIVVGPGYDYYVYVVRHAAGWTETHSHN